MIYEEIGPIYRKSQRDFRNCLLLSLAVGKWGKDQSPLGAEDPETRESNSRFGIFGLNGLEVIKNLQKPSLTLWQILTDVSNCILS